MKNFYFYSFLLGMMCLNIQFSQSLEILSDGDFSVTTKNISFDNSKPSTSAYFNKVISDTLSPIPEKVVIAGNFQGGLHCANDWDPNCPYTELTLNSTTGLFTGTFQVPGGSNRYRVPLNGSGDISYGENGVLHGADIFLCLPSGSEEITFVYDPSTNLVTTSPVTSGFSPECLPLVVLAGSFQDEQGCESDWVPDCTNSALTYNAGSGLFEGDFYIPPGCYEYRIVLESSWQNNYGQEGTHNGPNYNISIPENPDIIHFTYDPISHIVISSPYGATLEEVTRVSLVGTFQDELGCAYEWDFECDTPALVINPDSGVWEGGFTLPAGCYSYLVKETLGCDENYYGENGYEYGDVIQFYVPSESEIEFSYDPQTHIISSTPYSGAPQEASKVSLFGTLQEELGCDQDYSYGCDNPELVFNPELNTWEGTFNLPAGCYAYRVKETSICNEILFGENGIKYGAEIQLYFPVDGEITFSYNQETHIMTSTPYFDPPQEVTQVSLYGTLQNEFGCVYDYDGECNNPALQFNPDSGAWEGSFTLAPGCYTYYVKETISCNIMAIYGENGIEWGIEYQLYVTADEEITFSYDSKTRILSTTPNNPVPQEVRSVSLTGSFQDELGCAYDYNPECDIPELQFNSDSGNWEGTIMLPAGCYTYYVKETFGCNTFFFYGEDGIEYGDQIQLYLSIDGEITFTYDPQTHIISSTPGGSSTQEVSQVSLSGTLQDELGCDDDNLYDCDKPALQFNPDSGLWEGSFTLPVGCYTYWVKETFGCYNAYFYGENGVEYGYPIQLLVPTEEEITFSYDPQTHLISSTPYSGAPQEVRKVSLYGTLQDELGCLYDYQFECDNPALLFNSNLGVWEGTFTLPAGCYTYWVQETSGCDFKTFYGENGLEGGDQIQVFVPKDGEITFSYDPQNHIISSTPYTDISTVNQCPHDISVNNFPGDCGAIVDYPEFVTTADCGGEILSVTQTAGSPSGSFFPIGLTTNSFVLTKTTGEEITCSFDIVVSDTESPVISGLNQSHETLWPPNHKMVPVFIDYFVSDNCNLASTELSISSNEPENGHGDGNTSPDWEILDEHNIFLRAERSGKGDGREYYITIKVTDEFGNTTENILTVTVPHDQGKTSRSNPDNNKFILYPNGADDVINLKELKPSSNSVSNSSYIIFDMLGIMKKKGTIINDQIEVATLPSGVYILKFETGEGYLFKKFIKN